GAKTSLDKVADQLGFVDVSHDEVMPTRIFLSLRCRRARLFVVVLTMYQRGEAVPRVALDPFPYVEDRTAGRIHHHATNLSKRFEILDGNPERRQDHNVLCLDPAEIDVTSVRPPCVRRAGSRFPLPGHKELDAHRLEFRVHVRVMDDLARQVDSTIRKLLSRLLGVLDRPLHPVTEPELLR